MQADVVWELLLLFSSCVMELSPFFSIYKNNSQNNSQNCPISRTKSSRREGELNSLRHACWHGLEVAHFMSCILTRCSCWLTLGFNFVANWFMHEQRNLSAAQDLLKYTPRRSLRHFKIALVSLMHSLAEH